MALIRIKSHQMTKVTDSFCGLPLNASFKSIVFVQLIDSCIVNMIMFTSLYFIDLPCIFINICTYYNNKRENYNCMFLPHLSEVY